MSKNLFDTDTINIYKNKKCNCKKNKIEKNEDNCKEIDGNKSEEDLDDKNISEKEIPCWCKYFPKNNK